MTERFEFEVNLQELLNAADSISRALGGKESIPILQHMLFEVGKDKLTMRGFNTYLQTDRVLSIINGSGSGIKFCVPVFMFTVLSKYIDKNSFVTISQIEKEGKLLHRLVVSQGSRFNGFSFIEADEYPAKIQIDAYTKVDMLPLLEAFRLTAIGSLDVTDRLELRCYHLDNKGRLMCGNGIQFAKYEGLNVKSLDETVLLRVKTVLENIKFLNEISHYDDCEIGFSETWLGFRSLKAGYEIIFQQYTGKPMDLLLIFDTITVQEMLTKVIVSLDDLKNVLELSTLYEGQALSHAYPHYTTLSIARNELTFEIEIENLSSNVERIDVKNFEGEEITIKILVSKLGQMIKELTGDTVILQFYSKNDPFRVIAEDHIKTDIVGGDGEEVVIEDIIFEYLQVL